MTYVPVPEGEKKSTAGRDPVDIPDALVRQLQHSDATGARCYIDLSPDDDPAEVADLKRAIVRAGYRLFGTKTIHKKFTPDRVTYWVGPKIKRGKKT